MPGRNGFINADGTGAGKTRQALTVAHYYAKQGFKVMIVSKSETFKPNWKTNEFGGSYRFDSSAMGVPLEVVRDGNVAPGKIGITTYENMKSVERFTDSRTILIFDEAHALKNDSDRGRAGVRASAKANAVMFMSATPADKPVHIAYLARAGILEGKTIQQALVDLGMRLVEMDKMVKDDAGRWVKRRLHFWTEDQNVSDNDRNARFSALFDRMTAQGAMIKREISMDGTHIQVMKVSLPPEAHELQQEILNFFDASHIDDLKGLKKAVVLGHQRRQQEPYKIAPTIMLAKRELDQGRQVVIFVSRVNASEVGKWVKTGGGFGGEQERVREVLMSSEGTAKTMREALEDAGIHDIAEIHGNADQSSLEAMADFQGGRKRVVIATIESGGTGINLDDTIGNRPRSMIVVTAPFDAVGNVQAAGRIWRLKTMSGSNLYYLFADTSVDDWNADIIGSKMATLGAVVEGQVRRLDISNPDAVDTDDYHEQVKERAPEAPKPVTAFPQMEWKPFTTKAGASKFVAPATADFWKWYEANGKQSNPLNLRISKFNNQWQVWSDKPIASGPQQAQLPEEIEGKPAIIRPTTAVGLDEIRQAFEDPRLGLSPETVHVALDLVNQKFMRNLDKNQLILAVRQYLEGSARGQAWPMQGVIELSGTANPTTFPHEASHLAYESAFTPEEKSAINELRLAKLRERFGDNIPPELAAGTMTSDAFQSSGLPGDLYSLTNPSEFLADYFGERFAKESWDKYKAKPASFWETIRDKFKAFIRSLVFWKKRQERIRPDMEPFYEKLLSGKWHPTPESGAAFERQAQLPRTAEKAERELFFKAPGMGEALAASYGSVSKMTRAVADQVGANDRVKALLNLPKQEELAAIGTREVNLDNYYDVMNSIVNAPPAVKTEVTLGAWHLLNFEQSRSIFLEAAAAKQREVLNSPKFLRKLERLDTRQINLDTLTQAKDTFLNLIGQEAGTVIRQMSEKKAIDAQYEQLQEDLKRLRQMPQFSNDVANRVQDIVDTLSMVDGGLDLLYQSTNKSGDNIYRTYLDIKQSIARIGEPRNPAEMLSEWDRQFLSDADKAKLAKPGMDAMSRDSKAFAKLASQVLAVNRDMSAKLATLSFMKADPEFAQKVTEVGRQFARQVAQDPVKAVDTLAQKAAKLGGKVSNAETAWAALNKDVTREIQKYTDTNKAVDVLRELHASPEWQKLVNDIHANVERSVRTPDVVRKQMKSSADVFNEFVSNPIFVSPEGGTYQIDLGGTKQQAVQSWNQSRAYLDDIDRWLGDPKNEKSPDRQFWLDRRDFVEAVYMASTVTAPPAVLPLLPKGSSHSAWIPDYLFEQMTLPAARVARITFDNMNASYAASSGWVYNVQEKVTGTMALASLSHGIPVQYGLKAYQEQVLNQMAYLARNGQKVPVGTRLDGGIIVNARDVAALKMQGESVNSLMNLVANAGREKVMTDRLLLDEWAAGQFGLRAAKELGGEAGTTLPHQFSDRGKVLSREVANLIAKSRPMGDIEAVLNQSNNFPYVRLFTEQRKASFVTSLSPFEDLYRQLADKFLSGAPDAPRDIDEVVDYLTDNTPEEMNREQVKAQFMGELTGRLQKFYKGFVEHDDPSDIRFSRTKTSSALTKGFVQDVENSFFYDYGMASDADVRALATDAQNYHVVRIDMALESLQNELVNRLNSLRNTPEAEQAAFKKQARKELQSGASFLDFDRLENQLNELKMFRSAMPSWTGRRTIDAALVSKGTRIVGDVVSGRLTGWGSTARILVGSIYKMGTVYAALDHGMTFAWPKAAVSMAMSAFKVGVPSVAGGAYRVLRNTPEAVKAGLMTKGGLNVKLAVAIQHALEGVTEEIMRPSKYLAQQHQNGLVPDQLLGWRIANMLLMPQSRGRGYNPTKGRFLGNVPHNIGNLVLTAGELPLEVLRSYFPQLAYNIAYDSAARQAGWTVDVLEAAARRAFDVHEKMGTLGKFDLNNPSNPKNTLLASEVMPIGLVPKTQTSLNIARNWFCTIDLPYNEAVLNFWKRLSETPKAERGNIRMLSADIADPAKAQDMAERRTVALMAEALRNVHHAAPSNRPWIMRSVPILRIINPFIGWTAQTSRQWFSLIGRAAHDPEHGNAFLWATSVASVLGVLAWAAFNGDTDKRAQGLVKWWMLKEADSAKHFGQGETVGENLKILASDATAHIAMLNTAVNSMLGLEGARGGMNFTPMLVNEVNGWLQLARGMISTHDFTYGLEKWAGQEVPFYRTVTSRLPSQQGLIEQRAARTLIDKYGDPDMKRSLGGITQAPLPTELSPYKEALANAIFKGNPEEVQQAYTEFVAKATAMGKQNPEQLAKTTIRSLNPYQQVFGAKLTDEQRQHLIGRMSSDEATRLTTAENNYENAAHSVGIGSEITRQPRAAGGAASGGAVPVPAGLARMRTVSNRLRMPRGRSTRSSFRAPRMRAPKLTVSRSRFRRPRAVNRLRRRSTIV